MIVKNFNLLATTPERKTVLSLAEAGIESVLPLRALKRSLELRGDTLCTPNGHYNLTDKRIFVVGAGKASAAMAAALEQIIGAGLITAGIVLSNDVHARTEKIEVMNADHPVPSERNLAATRRLLSLKEMYHIDEHDVVIGLVSGGGSAMLVSPAEGITLADKQKVSTMLMTHGASGRENTTVKTALSQVKGGGLADHFSPASILSLVISDDNGSATHAMTASGPFSEKVVTCKDALDILRRFQLTESIPASVISFLAACSEKPAGKKVFSNVSQYIVAHNEDALQSVKEKAEGGGIAVMVEPNVRGEAKEIAYRICGDIHAQKITKPTLFIYGGETTVTLDHPHKKGGRNQEFILSCLQYVHARPFRGTWCIAAVGTDGIDFIEDSAGGIIDNTSLRLTREHGLDVFISSFLERHKAGRLLQQINSNIHIGGPTGTNVGDLILFYVSP